MLHYYDGSVFNVDTQAKVNTINCVGVMGAGIALEFKLRYPDMFEEYALNCKTKAIRIGEVNYYSDNEVTIVNFPTKMHFKYPSKIEWIEAGLKHFVQTYKSHNIHSIAFPKLGTNNGGLEWTSVKVLMEKYLSEIEAEVYICLDEKQEAEGLEREMVDYFNQNKEIIVNSIGKINALQREILLNCGPIRRFWHIGKLEKIGTTTYSKIFNYCKDAVSNGGVCQMPLM